MSFEMQKQAAFEEMMEKQSLSRELVDPIIKKSISGIKAKSILDIPSAFIKRTKATHAYNRALKDVGSLVKRHPGLTSTLGPAGREGPSYWKAVSKIQKIRKS
jgi:hypothetical protein